MAYSYHGMIRYIKMSKKECEGCYVYNYGYCSLRFNKISAPKCPCKTCIVKMMKCYEFCDSFRNLEGYYLGGSDIKNG